MKQEIHLRSDINTPEQDREYITTYKNNIPTNNGVHLINGNTGTGKTKYLTEQCKENSLCIFSMKSILQQQTNIAEQEQRELITKQLEHFVNTDIVELLKYKAIFIDEFQFIYEAGFRTQVVNSVRDKIETLRKHIAVYCLSGTFDINYSCIKFDSETYFIKEQLHRTIEVDISNNSNGTGTKAITMQDIVEQVIKSRTKFDMPILLFNNSIKDNADIVLELTKQGMNAISVHSDTKSNELDYILESESIKAANVDVVVSTSILKEGINIKDAVHIIATQEAAETITQEFGRGRNYELCKYTLLIGDGDYSQTKQQINNKVQDIKAINDKFILQQRLKEIGVEFDLTIITDDNHRDLLLKYAVSNSMKRRAAFGLEVVHDLIHQHGFDYYFSDESPLIDKFKLSTITKKLIVEAVNIFNEDEKKVLQYVQEQQPEIPTDITELYTNKAFTFRDNYIKLRYSDYDHDWLEAFTKLRNTDIAYISYIDSDIDLLRDFIKDKQSVLNNIPKELIQTYSDDFWLTARPCDKHIHEDLEYTQMRKRLFIHLCNLELVRCVNGDVYQQRDNKPWWSVDLDRKQSKTFSKRKKQIEQVIPVEQFYEATRMNQMDIVNTKPKVIKSQLESIK